MSAALHLSLLLPVLLTAVYVDVRERRIPNGVIVLGVCLAAAAVVPQDLGWLATAGVGASSTLSMLLGLLLGLGAGVTLFALGALGAGDGKLLAVVGAFLGPLGLVLAVLYGGVAGGVVALVGAVRRHTVIPVLLRTRDLGLHLLSFGKAGERWSVDSPGAVSIPFAVPIAIGTLLAWFFPGLPGGTP